MKGKKTIELNFRFVYFESKEPKNAAKTLMVASHKSLEERAHATFLRLNFEVFQTNVAKF